MHANKQDHPGSISGVASADRTLAVLTAFRRGDAALGLGELSNRTGLVKSTIMRLAISLERYGLLKRLSDGTYRLDAEVMRLGSIYRESLDLESHVMPVLRRLVSKTEESASFYVRNGDWRLCLYRVDSPHPLRLHIHPGDMLPMDDSSVAEVLRRFDTQEQRKENWLNIPLYTISIGGAGDQRSDPDRTYLSGSRMKAVAAPWVQLAWGSAGYHRARRLPRSQRSLSVRPYEMDQTSATGILDFVSEAGLRGFSEAELLRGFCERLRSGAVPVARAIVLIDTLHPVHEGHVFRWRRDGVEFTPVTEYGRVSDGGATAQKWAASPFNHLLVGGEAELRRRLARGETADFPILDELRSEGQTDYVALIHRFAEGTLGEMDGVYSSWTTDEPGGFTEPQLGFLRQLLPTFALGLKCVSLGRVAETLVKTYLGRDAGQRVLSGRIGRGVAERISAVIWYSDLRGFTRITDIAAPDEVIPFLNDYADAIISSVHEAGGDILKLMGDGTLAIFKVDNPGAACASALKAEALMRARIDAVSARRSAGALPITDAYLGLHIGEVFYGNIGSEDRLDFTVVGPAVNEASRIAALCRSVEKDVLISSAFAGASLPGDRARFVGVGRYGLRGVERAQELFTLERA